MVLSLLRSVPGPAAATASSPAEGGLSPHDAASLAVRVDGRGGGSFDTGSGVAITSRVVLTNRHLVDERMVFATACSVVDLGVRQVLRSETLDVALIEIAGPDMEPVELAAEDPEPDTPVLMPGFPGGGPVASIQGQVEDYLPTAGGSLVLRFSPTPAIGQSGSPLLDPEGRLVGLAYAVDQVSGMGHAIPASELRRAMAALAADQVEFVRDVALLALPGADERPALRKPDKAILRLVGVLNGTASPRGANPPATGSTAC